MDVDSKLCRFLLIVDLLDLLDHAKRRFEVTRIVLLKDLVFGVWGKLDLVLGDFKLSLHFFSVDEVYDDNLF